MLQADRRHNPPAGPVAPVSEPERSVLTIGHSTHCVEDFLGLLRRHGVNVVADVRSMPYSRFNPRFNRDAVRSALRSNGIHYVYLGSELGGRSRDEAHYDMDDHHARINYDRVRAEGSFKAGLRRVLDGVDKGYRIALMCVEKEPLDCHRTLLVARALGDGELAGKQIGIAHIHADGRLESQDEAMDRLLERHKLADDDSPLFTDSGAGGVEAGLGTREDRIAKAVRLQAARVAHTRRPRAHKDKETS